MTVVSSFAVAAVKLNTHLPPGAALAPACSPYLQFAGAGAGAGGVSCAGSAIDVMAVLDPPPAADGMAPLLSDGTGWALLGDGARRRLRLGGVDDATPMRVVGEWDLDAASATAFVAPHAVHAGERGTEIDDPVRYPLDQLLLMYHLARRGGLLVHAAGVTAGGRALIFPGVSGAGKSTLARHFMAGRWPALLSDDRIVVRELEGRFTAFGTPWPGDAGVAVNDGAPLAGILFPVRGESSRIDALTPQAALDRLLPATSMLWHEQELLFGQLETCERLLRAIPAFELAWSPNSGVTDDVDALLRQL